MSGEDAEMALLHKIQAAQAENQWGAATTEGEEHTQEEQAEEESSTEHKNPSVKRENVEDDDDQEVLRSLSPTAGAQDDDEYDPSSVVIPPPSAIVTLPQDSSRSSSRASVQKPKKVGGFVADDDEEDDVQPSSTGQENGALQLPVSNTSYRTLSPSPLQKSVTQEDVKSPLGQVDQNGTLSSIASSNPSGAVSVPVQAAPVSASAITSGQPKARLPHDTIGLLEDRIKEDPRGDLDAWMSLISEYRGRSKFEEAKEVYERFLKLFPHAVSETLLNNSL